MADYEKMKADVAASIRDGVASRSSAAVRDAVGVYLGHVASNTFGMPDGINAAVADAIDAGLMTAEDVMTLNKMATPRLTDGLFWRPSVDGPGTRRLASLVRPYADETVFTEALGKRWCLNGRQIAERVLPFVSRHTEAGKVALARIEASAEEMLRAAARRQDATRTDASADMMEDVLKFVERDLNRLVETALDPSAPDLAFAAKEVASEQEPEFFASIPEAVIEKVFASGSKAVERPRGDLRGMASAAIREIIGRLSDSLARKFEVEKPSFADWSWIASSMAVLQKLCDDGMDVLSGVAEGSRVDESKTFVIFQGWDQLHTLERYVDLDSVDHGFSDEYTRCDCGSCNVAVRTSPNSYDWQPGFIASDYGVVLLEHADDDDVEGYISERINNANGAINCPGLDISRVGFRKLDDGFEAGWHPGQNDDPKAILKDLRKKFPNAEFLFRVDGVGQFDMNFSVWVRGDVEQGARAEDQ